MAVADALCWKELLTWEQFIARVELIGGRVVRFKGRATGDRELVRMVNVLDSNWLLLGRKGFVGQGLSLASL